MSDYQYKSGKLCLLNEQSLLDLSNMTNDNLTIHIDSKLKIKDTPININNLTIFSKMSDNIEFKHPINAKKINIQRTNVNCTDITCDSIKFTNCGSLYINGTIQCNDFEIFDSIGDYDTKKFNRIITNTFKTSISVFECVDVQTNTIIIPLGEELSKFRDVDANHNNILGYIANNRIKTNNITLLCSHRNLKNKVNIPFDTKKLSLKTSTSIHATTECLSTKKCDSCTIDDMDINTITLKECDVLDITNAKINTLIVNHPCKTTKLDNVVITNITLDVTDTIELSNMTVSKHTNPNILNNNIKNLTLKNCEVTDSWNLKVTNKVTISNCRISAEATESIKNCGAKLVYMDVQ